MTERTFWICRQEETYGPYSEDEIREYADRFTLVSYEDR